MLSNFIYKLKQINRGNYTNLKKYKKRSVAVVRLAQWKKMLEKERSQIVKKVKLTSTQKKEIKQFYKKHLGSKISLRWHRYYQGLSDSFDVKYVPEIIYEEMEFLLNDHDFSNTISNKLLQYRLFDTIDGVYVPKLYAQVENGFWYDCNKNKLSIEDVCKIFVDAEIVFAKPIKDSSSGKGCEIIRISDGKEIKTGKEIADYLTKFEDNFLFQEVIKCSEDVAKLHPNSVNTFRIMSVNVDNEVFVCPLVMRIGRNKNEIDNAHAGGLTVAVSYEGDILSNGITEFNERISTHPDTNINFIGYHIKNVDRVIDAVKRMHAIIPELKIASWDMTLNEKEIPTFIEINSFFQSPWLLQMTHGKGFLGEKTEEMLSILRKYRKM